MARNDPVKLARMGIDAPYPSDVKPPVIDPKRPDLVVTEFPGRYLTPFHFRMQRVWQRMRDGYPPRRDGTLHWPAVMMQSFDLLDSETARFDKSRRK